MSGGGIRKGLRVQYDEEAKIVDEQIKLDANRPKGNFEKNLDNLLFGPPVKKPPAKDPKKQEEKKKQQQQRMKQEEERKRKQKEQILRAQQLERKRLQEQEMRRREQQQRLRQEQEDRKKVPGQPEQYIVVDMGQPYRMELDVKHVYNRPIYIRKFKKIAEDFGYYTQNQRRNHATDVVRPVQCIRKQIFKNRVPNFIDTSFPPNERALGPALRGMVSSWNRASQIAKKPVLGKYIDPNDIKAGRFSSPQFLSTLSCLAERENNIKRMIENQIINEDGFYYVRIFLNAVWRYVVVDDSIPILGGQPACATSYLDDQTDLWVALVQKAYAKLFLQGYHLFATVQSHQLYLRDLTGAPSHVYPMNNPDIMKIISAALEKGWGLIAVGNEQSLNVGLNPNFSFNILKCDAKGLQLRNSWGSIEEKSSLNTTKEGTFQMNLEQCKKFLNHVIVAKTNDNYFSTVIQGKHSKGFCGSYTFKIRNQTRGFLTLSQTDERLIPSHIGYKYSSSKIILEKKTVQGGSFVNAMTGDNWRNIDLEVILSPGQYIVHTIVDYKADEYDYFLSWYGEQQIEFKKAYSRYYPEIIYQSLQPICLNEGKQINARGGISQYVLHHQPSNLVIYTVQNTTDRQANASVDFSKIDFSNLVLLTCKNKGDNLCEMSKHQLKEYRQNCYKDKRWLASLGPHEAFTWVLSSTVPYSKANLQKWGFR